MVTWAGGKSVSDDNFGTKISLSVAPAASRVPKKTVVAKLSQKVQSAWNAIDLQNDMGWMAVVATAGVAAC